VKPGLIRIEASLVRSLERVLSPGQLQADPALVAQGWERRFTADAQRAKEAMELYEQLGYEVAFHFLAIYTRKKSD